eukprot:TRINITY_DN1943_c0_g1_i6.p2 TRINITY_DN1943_c0_g1~~TRINITY_DN1943_c0_g1_i6.p2  ORF type:complete len:147 (+),score=29.33 TRINITY_DN1943_c0_g1_i6:219-659(+)
MAESAPQYAPTQPGYPAQGYPPQQYPPQGYPPQGYPPQGYQQQPYPPQGYQTGYAAPPPAQGPIVINMTNNQQQQQAGGSTVVTQAIVPRYSTSTALWGSVGLACCLQVHGFHYCYTGSVGLGLLSFFTYGGCWVSCSRHLLAALV